jgi:putative glutamine amidotransferase
LKPILITQRLAAVEDYAETRECLDLRWAALVSGLGFLPIPLPYLADPAPYFEQLAPAGVILSGGNDLSSVADSALNEHRDHMEGAVLELALRHEVPVLGVCRGAQFLTERFGGAVQKVAGHVATRHALFFALSQPPDWAANLLAPLQELQEVSSFHNWGIEKLGSTLVPLAHDENGNIEALAHPTKRILGIMWHPEREDASATQTNLLRSFFSGD